MDPHFSHSKSTARRPETTLRISSSSNLSVPIDNGGAIVETARALRRGHSDSDVLVPAAGVHTIDVAEEISGRGETWHDFMRHIPHGDGDSIERSRAAVRRAALVSADRNRRLQETREDAFRRRATTAASWDWASSDRARTRVASTSTSIINPQTPRFGPPEGRATGSAWPNRLPPMPVVDYQKSASNQEPILPRWQPDAEVSECPICGRSFAFWYRKHHCRKCGRVVCANCSPHKITIPRQFIVQPPADLESGSVETGRSSIEVIDLCGDDDERATGSSTHDTNKSHNVHHRSDYTSGGGLEVRLCNPCVPDPNPLPPPLYSSSRPDPFPSFSALESTSPTYQRIAGSIEGIQASGRLKKFIDPRALEQRRHAEDRHPDSSRRHTLQAASSTPPSPMYQVGRSRMDYPTPIHPVRPPFRASKSDLQLT